MKKMALTPRVGRIDHAAATQKLSIPPWYATSLLLRRSQGRGNLSTGPVFRNGRMLPPGTLAS